MIFRGGGVGAISRQFPLACQEDEKTPGRNHQANPAASHRAVRLDVGRIDQSITATPLI